MALSLASPGIKVREVDLTRGGTTNTTSISAGIAAPFAKGPVNQVVTITNENELVNVFGKPSTSDYHYEYWYSASNFLSYGGSLKVVRCGGTNLKNSNAGVGVASTSTVSIDNYEDYQATTLTSAYWVAKNQGSWAEGLKVCVIDNFADQTLSGINTSNVSVGYGVSQALSGVIAGVGTTTAASGYLRGIITGIGASTVYVKVTSQEYTENGVYAFAADTAVTVHTSSGVTTATAPP